MDPEFGTGCLKITPGHDITDYAVGQANGLPIINIMNDDGSLNANAAAYNGMDRFAARKAVWADLQVVSAPSQRRELSGFEAEVMMLTSIATEPSAGHQGRELPNAGAQIAARR